MSDWVKFRIELFENQLANIENLLGKESVRFKKYRIDYEKIFEERWNPSHQTELAQSVQAAKVIFLSDFHALAQSQKSIFKILQGTSKYSKKALAVEFVEQRHQKILDQFMQGKILESEFLKKTKWKSNWGYPWECYRPILAWAKSNKVSTIALNSGVRKKTDASLTERDQAAAESLSKLVLGNEKKGNDVQIFVVFGDLHLAPNHLPGRLRKICPNLSHQDIVTILQNSEKLYFALARKGQEAQVEVIRLPNNCFCLNTVPPWIKWQSYLQSLQAIANKGVDFEFVDEPEGYDLSEIVEKNIKLLQKELKLAIEVGDFSIYRANDELLFERIRSAHIEQKKISARAKKKARKSSQPKSAFLPLIKANGSFYLPELNLGVVQSHADNYLAAMAMAIIYASSSRTVRMPELNDKEFMGLIWGQALEYFGSKILNPKRKTESSLDIKALGAKRGAESQYQLAYEQLMKEKAYSSFSKLIVPLSRRFKKEDYFLAAKILGALLGEKIYYGYRHHFLSLPMIHRFLRQNIADADFTDFYLESKKLIESLPEGFQHKSERL